MRPCYHKSSRRSSTGHCYTTNTLLAANEQALDRPKPLKPNNHGLVSGGSKTLVCGTFRASLSLRPVEAATAGCDEPI